jgi:hypothetical protein
MQKLMVLSSEEQYETALKHGLSMADFKILCDNESFQDFLDRRGVVYEELSEFDIRKHWDEINIWGWSKAASFIKLAREHGFFRDVDLPSVIYGWFNVILILLLKNVIYAQTILEKHRPEEVVVFNSRQNYLWTEYSGNAFLNYFLGEFAGRAGARILALEIIGRREAVLPYPSTKWKKFFRAIIKKCIQGVYGFLVRPPKHADVMVYGTLRHLAATAEELRKNGARIVFYDDEFRLEHFRFCLASKIAYLIPDCFRNSPLIDRIVFTNQLKAENARFWKSPAPRGHFLYGNLDLSEFLYNNFFENSMDVYLARLSQEANHYENLLADCRPSAVLLDEDFNAHAFFASFMKSKGILVFCNSHANLSFDCVVQHDDKCFSTSYTFVQAEQEKDGYRERGWDPEKLLVTGLPRYDALVRTKQKKMDPFSAKNPVKILYSAALPWPYGPNAVGWVGSDIFGYKRNQEKALRAIFHAARDLPLSIIIKPHYTEDEDPWKSFVSRERPSCTVKVLKASEDFSKLLFDCDAMATAIWSSTVIEAGIADVPVISIDLNDLKSRHIERFAESGLSEICRNDSDLRSAFEKLCRRENAAVLPRELTLKQKYFLGELDGKSRSRVAEFILNKIMERANV